MANTTHGVCRRRAERFAARLEVRFGTTALDRTEIAGNISEGGLYIRTHEVYKVGTRIRLELELAGRTVHHDGEVMWAIAAPSHMRATMDCGMGIQFVNSEPQWLDCFQKWKDSLESLEPLPYSPK